MTISRTAPIAPDRARTLAARALDDAMESLGISDAALARHLGCDEKVVRNLRCGAAPLTGAVILRLPASLRVAVLRGLELAATTPASAASREAQGCAVQIAATDVIAALARAMGDGRITDAEVRDLIGPALARLDASAAPLRASAGGDA